MGSMYVGGLVLFVGIPCWRCWRWFGEVSLLNFVAYWLAMVVIEELKRNKGRW